MENNTPNSDTVALSFVQQQALLEEALRANEDVDNALDEVKRELGVRKRVYPGWIEKGNLTRLQAKTQYQGLVIAQTFLEVLSGLRQAMPGLVTNPKPDNDVPF
jgi:hypothetical protein